ncbi:unnamed protein product [Mytilus coruscus]|uniref:Uncharacterized protein n=1 Tax=Mytilus coruscus TaxID=42192 RepID=A0A6J8EZ34_MYTCO|nr:unnamed protein product [Mytilus coruscus]
MDLNKLKSRRKANRSVVTRHLRKIEVLKNAAELPRVDLLATFESVEQKKKLLDDLNQQILNAIDSEDIEEEIMNTDEYTLDLDTKLKHLRIFIQSLDNSNNHTNQQSTSYQTLNYEAPPFIPTSCIENQQHSYIAPSLSTTKNIEVSLEELITRDVTEKQNITYRTTELEKKKMRVNKVPYKTVDCPRRQASLKADEDGSAIKWRYSRSNSKKSLDTNALVKLAHCAIELANEHVSRADSNKKRKGEGDNQAGQSKKGKTNEPWAVCVGSGRTLKLSKFDTSGLARQEKNHVLIDYVSTKDRAGDLGSPHSTHSGCALTLAWLGIDKDAIKLHNSDLKQQIDEMKKSLSVDTVAQALREVKEYAARAGEINVDSLQMKLLHFDEMGRRYDHNDKELFSLSQRVPVTTIQKFTGLCISMCLAIPGAKLYTSAANQAISNAILNSSNVLIDDEIKVEIMYWEFLDTWDKPFLWISDRHFILEISTDSSGYKWGATISGKDMKEGIISDYWDQKSLKLPIM